MEQIWLRVSPNMEKYPAAKLATMQSDFHISLSYDLRQNSNRPSDKCRFRHENAKLIFLFSTFVLCLGT